MPTLTNEKCTACKSGAPLVTEAEIRELKLQIPDWKLVERDDIQRLERVFNFKDFVSAMDTLLVSAARVKKALGALLEPQQPATVKPAEVPKPEPVKTAEPKKAPQPEAAGAPQPPKGPEIPPATQKK